MFYSIITCDLAPMVRISGFDRAMALGQMQADMSPANVANAFGVNERKMFCLRQHYAQTNSVKGCPRSGRHKATTHEEDRYIRNTVIFETRTLHKLGLHKAVGWCNQILTVK